VAPTEGTYKISAQFAGIHFRMSTTDVHVLDNDRSLFDADIDGYGGDPAFNKVEGSSPTAAYSGQIEMELTRPSILPSGTEKTKLTSVTRRDSSPESP
jgi:hypothetical protein